jgi:acetyltransferase-like isoleucine patch superfamily enzyme
MGELAAWKAVRVLRAMAYYRLRGVEFEGMPYIRGMLPRVTSKGNIRVGDRFKVNGLQHRVDFGAAAGGELLIGDDVFLNRGVAIYAARKIEIGDHTRVGDLATINDSDIHETEPGRPIRVEPVTIGRNVWIGQKAVILPGITIGDHAIVGASAVVTRSIPSRSVAVGNPARVVREIEAPDDWVRH